MHVSGHGEVAELIEPHAGNRTLHTGLAGAQAGIAKGTPRLASRLVLSRRQARDGSSGGRFQLKGLRNRARRRIVPNLPGSIFLIQFFEPVFVFESIHAGPETIVAVAD